MVFFLLRNANGDGTKRADGTKWADGIKWADGTKRTHGLKRNDRICRSNGQYNGTTTYVTSNIGTTKIDTAAADAEGAASSHAAAHGATTPTRIQSERWDDAEYATAVQHRAADDEKSTSTDATLR